MVIYTRKHAIEWNVIIQDIKILLYFVFSYFILGAYICITSNYQYVPPIFAIQINCDKWNKNEGILLLFSK